MYNPLYGNLPLTLKIVLRLLHKLLNEGYNLNTDIFYISPTLADYISAETKWQDGDFTTKP